MENLLTNALFILATIGMLAIVFIILYAVGYRRNKAYRNATPEERAAMFNREPHVHDIVLLSDGVRVTLVDVLEDGKSFAAETVQEYGKRPEKRKIARDDIVKIEYFS